MDEMHHLPPQQALTAVDSSAQGLSHAEAARPRGATPVGTRARRPLAPSRNVPVTGEMAYLFNCRHLLVPVRSWTDFSGNFYVLLTIVTAFIQAIITYAPFCKPCTIWPPGDASWPLGWDARGGIFVIRRINKT
jgi:hypothetical protein